MPVYLVLDGLMLVHWKKTTIDIKIPWTEGHVKEVTVGSTTQDLKEGAHELVFSGLDPGEQLDDKFYKKHFCLNGKEVTVDPDAKPYVLIKDIPFPSAVYGQKRYASLQLLLLNGESPNVLAESTDPFVVFCERIVLEYNASSLKFDGEISENYVVITSVAPKEMAKGMHMATAHGQPFNDLLLLKDKSHPSFRVTGLRKSQVLKLEDDVVPIQLPAVHIETIEGQDCAANFLMGPY